MAERRGHGDAVLEALEIARPQTGRLRADGAGQGGRRASRHPSVDARARAHALWRVAQGSNAAVLKKIAQGGAHTAKELARQVDYLFSKSEALFGNMVEHDPEARSLSGQERKGLVADWADGWTGATKNGHTTHLLMSFPAHVRPETARDIAELWAFEMFQSGAHQDEEWAYVAALHTDRAHPHVHIVVNNRGLMQDDWFFMAKNHVFNFQMMKERMVALAAEEGVFLDASSRLDRGILTYGPSRAEIERARSEGRAPREKRRDGPALEAALAHVAQSGETLKFLARVAALTGAREIEARIGDAVERLRAGGIRHPYSPLNGESDMALNDGTDVMDTQTGIAARADLARHFGRWMEEAEEKIAAKPEAARAELRDELYDIAAEVWRGLGDSRSAELMGQGPQTALYGTRLTGDRLETGGEDVELGQGALDGFRADLIDAATEAGLDGARVLGRLEAGAANAYQERDWIRADLGDVATRHRLDLGRDEDRTRAADLVDRFYEKAAGLLEAARGRAVAPESDRLVRTLGSMAEIHDRHGRVEFEREEHAERFARDLKERYGEDIVRDLAQGRDDRLAGDFPDAGKRQAIAGAVVAAAKEHESLGLSLSEVEKAEERLRDRDRGEEREM